MPFGLVEVNVVKEEPSASIPTAQMEAAGPPPLQPRNVVYFLPHSMTSYTKRP
jgi:hypothetical protein